MNPFSKVSPGTTDSNPWFPTTSRGNSIRHWLVRKGINGGSSWSTVDDFQPSGSNAEARCFAATSNGDLDVAGVIGSYGAYRGIVRKNPGGTGTWTTIDDYQYAPGFSARDGPGNGGNRQPGRLHDDQVFRRERAALDQPLRRAEPLSGHRFGHCGG